MSVLSAPTLDSLVLALLFCGHLLADFVFQSRAMVEGKRKELSWRLAHGVEVLIVQALVLLPFLPGLRPSLAVAVIALSHTAIDALKVAVEGRFGRRLRWFVFDQLAHAVVLVAAAQWILPTPEFARWTPRFLEPVAWTVGLYAFNVNGGSAVVASILSRLRSSKEAGDLEHDGAHAGHTIGILERMVMLSLVWLGQWSALGFVLTAKSVARFKELEDKRFAEAYMVGTLTSFLVAGGSGYILRQLVGVPGP